jgi:hypothetical protein
MKLEKGEIKIGKHFSRNEERFQELVGRFYRRMFIAI